MSSLPSEPALPGSDSLEHGSLAFDATPFRSFYRVHALLIAVLPPAGTVVALSVSSGADLGVGIATLVPMYLLTLIGVELGLHRCLSHRCFETTPWLRATLGILGSTAAQGSVVYWVANHRRHHGFADRDQDPHSPHAGGAGFWHAHIGWIFCSEVTNSVRFCKDLLRDRAVMRVNRHYVSWVALGFVVPTVGAGIATGSVAGCVSGFLWGGLVRLLLVQHVTFAVNSVCHSWGARSFPTSDRSTNVWWLALPSLGGAWHNNHHAFPRTADNGFSWWQLDPTAWLVRLLERSHLVWNVWRPARAAIANRAIDARLADRDEGDSHDSAE